jgi:GDP-mannose 6-dehydrogenase
MPHDLTLLETRFRTDAEQPTVLSIIGLGYVGAVSAACYASMRYRVIGVDLDNAKVAAITAGRAPIVETGLNDLIARGAVEGRLGACTSVRDAVLTSQISFICVGTPSLASGEADLSALRAVARDVGQALREKNDYHLVVVRSTVPAGTTGTVVRPILESESGRRCGIDFGLCFQPEFLREGVAVNDFFSPPKTVIGATDERSGKMLAALYAGIDAPLILTSIDSAEMLKHVDNTWHALKVAFANEVGRICQRLGADSEEVMGIFVRDTKLNLSPYYLRPGFAFGGSCLPKDVRSMCSIARSRGVEAPLLHSILPSNDVHIRHALALIDGSGAKRIGMLGVTFKTGTDDLRESPQLELVARLLDAEVELRLHDRHITPAGISLAKAHSAASSAETRAALTALPDLLFPTAQDVVDWADIVVVAHATGESAQALRASIVKPVLDLARLPTDLRARPGYVGVCW